MQNKKHPVRSGARKPNRKSGGGAFALLAVLLVVALVGGVSAFVMLRNARPQAQAASAATQSPDATDDPLAAWDDAEWSPDVWNDEAFAGDWDTSSFDDAQSDAAFGGEDGWNQDGLLGDLLQGDGETVVVAEFDGGELLLSEMVSVYNAGLFGDAVGDESFLMSVMQQLVAEKICRQKAEALGVSELSQQELAEVRAQAHEDYARYYRALRPQYVQDGLSEAEIAAATDAALEAMGITEAALCEEQIENRRWQKLFDAVTQDVTVTDEEIAARYETLKASQKDDFSQYPEDYAYTFVGGGAVAWRPDGFRSVLQILLTCEDEATADRIAALYEQLYELTSSSGEFEQILSVQDQIGALYQTVDAEAEALLARIRGGEPFQDVMRSATRDEAALEEPVLTQGWPISADCTSLYPQEVVDAALTLTTPGEVSTPIETQNGVVLLYYLSNLPGGDIPLSEARAAIANALLDEKKNEAFTDLEAQWIQEANVRYYPERVM